MNTPSTPSPVSSREMTGQLRMIEHAGRNLFRLAAGWAGLSVICWLAARSSESGSTLAQLGASGSLAVGLLYLGRWIQNRRMERWLRSHPAQAPAASAAPDFSSLEDNFPTFAIRAYASIQEARGRGWSFGPDAGAFQGDAIPAWAQMEGQRFTFAGLAPVGGVPVVPEDVRLFGRLRYQLPQDQQAATP